MVSLSRKLLLGYYCQTEQRLQCGQGILSRWLGQSSAGNLTPTMLIHTTVAKKSKGPSPCVSLQRKLNAIFAIKESCLKKAWPVERKQVLNLELRDSWYLACLLLWIELPHHHPKGYVDIVIPGTFDYELNLKCNEVQISLGWALIQYDWCPWKKWKNAVWGQTHREDVTWQQR